MQKQAGDIISPRKTASGYLQGNIIRCYKYLLHCIGCFTGFLIAKFTAWVPNCKVQDSKIRKYERRVFSQISFTIMYVTAFTTNQQNVEQTEQNVAVESPNPFRCGGFQQQKSIFCVCSTKKHLLINSKPYLNQKMQRTHPDKLKPTVPLQNFCNSAKN